MQRALSALGFVLLCAACGDNLAADPDASNNNGNSDGDVADTDGTPAIDAADQPDAAVGVTCGAATCAGGMECCVQGQNRTCVASGTCNGVNFDCDGNEDCMTAGDVCCFRAGGGPQSGSSCGPAAGCTTPTCGTAADCPAGQNLMCCTVGDLDVCMAACPP